MMPLPDPRWAMSKAFLRGFGIAIINQYRTYKYPFRFQKVIKEEIGHAVLILFLRCRMWTFI